MQNARSTCMTIFLIIGLTKFEHLCAGEYVFSKFFPLFDSRLSVLNFGLIFKMNSVECVQ